jgi:hypothetical protein
MKARVKFVLEWEKRWNEGEGRLNFAQLAVSSASVGKSVTTASDGIERQIATCAACRSGLDDRFRPPPRSPIRSRTSRFAIRHTLRQRPAVRLRRSWRTHEALGLVDTAGDPTRAHRARQTPAKWSTGAVSPHSRGRDRETSASTLRAQQRAFDFFRKEYNEDRAHEALGQEPPMTVYTCSPRRYPRPLERFEIDPWNPLVRVDKNGFIRWEKRQVFISTALAHEDIGLRYDGEEEKWSVVFGPLLIGRLYETPSGPPFTPTRGRIADLEHSKV